MGGPDPRTPTDPGPGEPAQPRTRRRNPRPGGGAPPRREHSGDLSVSASHLLEPIQRGEDLGEVARHRRISYFMAFRLGLLAAFTVVAAYTTWLAEDHSVGPRDWLTWATIALGYVLTLVFAWRMRPDRGPLPREVLSRIATTQTGFDILLAAASVVITGGAHSGLVFLFPVAVLGAATMGDRRQIWASAAICGLFYAGFSLAQFIDLVRPLHGPGEVLTTLDPKVLWVSLLRTSTAIGLVAILSAHLNTQLLSSVSQVGDLRALNEDIVRSLSSGLLTVDPSGLVLFANPTANELLGEPRSLTGEPCDALIPGLEAHLESSAASRQRFELRVVRRDDQRRVHLGLSSSPLLDDTGAFLGHVVNFQDVTELRRMEQELRRSERLAALGGLAASVAHEVRNPLAAISGCAELLDTDAIDDEDQRLIRVIRRESVRLNRIVTELLDFTRARELQCTEVDLNQTLLELAEAFAADPNNAQVELVTTLPEPALSAQLDPVQLSQALWNLVRNGAQAMDNDGRLELSVTAVGDSVRIGVRDFGRGIPKSDLERIFEPFYSTKQGGSGIGLALVHRIVEDHGGEIRVDSKVGEGTRISVDLPRRSSSAAPVLKK